MNIDTRNIDYSRRKITSNIISIITLCFAPINVAISAWNKHAFNATEYKDSLLALGIKDLNHKSNNITLNAPDIAENGAIVPIEVTSNVKDTDSIFIFVKDNPQPFTAKYKFSKNTLPFISTRIKMRKSTDLVVIVSDLKKNYYSIEKFIDITIGGCGE